MIEDYDPLELQPRTFTFQTIADLYATPDEQTEYCVDGLLPLQGLSVLAGKPKAGKSTLVRQLAVAVAQGETFLGRQTVQGKVLYIALEEKRSEVKRHFQDLGLTSLDPVVVHCDSAPKDALKLLQATLEAEPDVKLIIIDPIFKFTRVGDSNDYAKVCAAFEPVLSLTRRYGLHLMMVHHKKKKRSEDGMDDVLGSTAIAAAVDTVMTLDIDSQQRSIATRQRYGRDLPTTLLTFNAERRIVSLGMTAEEAEHVKANRITNRIENQILIFVTGHPCCTQEHIFEAVRGKTTTMKFVFRGLVDSGILSESGGGSKSNPFSYTIAEIVET